MKLVTGIDLIEIQRMERGMSRHGQRFCDRFFTPQEQVYCEGKPTRLAGRFAIKEAVGKALGTGIGDIRWVDVEIICDEQGKPHLILHNNARKLAERMGLTVWSISLSHTETHAIGMAVAIGEE